MLRDYKIYYNHSFVLITSNKEQNNEKNKNLGNLQDEKQAINKKLANLQIDNDDMAIKLSKKEYHAKFSAHCSGTNIQRRTQL